MAAPASQNIRAPQAVGSHTDQIADNYEPDDTCASARPIAVNGVVQAHNFHQAGDVDWVWLDVIAGRTYISQVSQAEANADTTLELYSACPQPPLASNDNIYGAGFIVKFKTSYTGRLYVKVTNVNPAIYGSQTGYNLSARIVSQSPIAVIVGGTHNLQSNIDYSTDMAYRTFLNGGVPKANLKYFSPNPARDVDGNGLNDDIAAQPSPAAVQDAIQNWALERGVASGVPFFLYLIGNGSYDQLMISGAQGKIGAADLNLWLSNLEAASGADTINVIIESCKSGSFIDVTGDGPASISGPRRVVITSTSSTLDAYTSARGAMFSDTFWTELGQNTDLKTAFDRTKQAIATIGINQQPWLDDNGDGVADDKDGAFALTRKLSVQTNQTPADTYEPDDSCASAQPITPNGTVQPHNFHQAGDADWVWLDVIAGKTYIIQTSQVETHADTLLELSKDCAGTFLARSDNVYGSDANMTWKANYTGRAYVTVTNVPSNAYGANTSYNLSARLASLSSVAVIVGGHDDNYSLQSNIDHSTDMAYRTLLNSGVQKSNLKYFSPNPNRDVDGNGLNDDIAARPTPDAIRDAIQDWARSRGVGLGVPFFLYMADHGYYDRFLADGTQGVLWAGDLNLWLSNLETTTGADMINVIIEACKSGSFIDASPAWSAQISAPGRVVITSTSSTLDARPSLQGSMFSDIFWTELGQNKDLKTAFDHARQAVMTVTENNQQPWLDDNGDQVADSQDGALARNRGLGGTYGSISPVVDWVQVTLNRGNGGTIQAQVRDDFGVGAAWVQVYEPDFVEPAPSMDGSTPQLNLPTITLTNTSSDQYQASFSFNKCGRYRLVVYARDEDGYIAIPKVKTVDIGQQTFLPILHQ